MLGFIMYELVTYHVLSSRQLCLAASKDIALSTIDKIFDMMVVIVTLRVLRFDW